MVKQGLSAVSREPALYRGSKSPSVTHVISWLPQQKHLLADGAMTTSINMTSP